MHTISRLPVAHHPQNHINASRYGNCAFLRRAKGNVAVILEKVAEQTHTPRRTPQFTLALRSKKKKGLVDTLSLPLSLSFTALYYYSVLFFFFWLHDAIFGIRRRVSKIPMIQKMERIEILRHYIIYIYILLGVYTTNIEITRTDFFKHSLSLPLLPLC